MSPDPEGTPEQKLDEAIRLASSDNLEAASFLRAIALAARIADDLLDEPESVRSADVERFVRIFTTDIPTNRFYLQNFGPLSTQIAVAANAWFDANALEGSGDKLQWNYSRVLRDYINELCPLVALLVRGPGYMRAVSPQIRRLFFKDEFR